MLSKSSKWELGFVHYIVKFTIYWTISSSNFEDLLSILHLIKWIIWYSEQKGSNGLVHYIEVWVCYTYWNEYTRGGLFFAQQKLEPGRGGCHSFMNQSVWGAQIPVTFWAFLPQGNRFGTNQDSHPLPKRRYIRLKWR